ncbi:hypothetical protein JXJ21_08905 [candidate division KSB1 bacterium]|nr:hypothetical protein [candidate division KSB1 bacterium]
MIYRKCRYIVCYLSICLIIVPEAFANPEYNVSRFGLALYGSGVKMVLGRKDDSTIEQWVGVQGRYVFNPYIAFGLTTAFGWVYARSENGSQFSASGDFKTFLIPIEFSSRCYMVKHARIIPYIDLGVGATNWDVRRMSNDDDSFMARGVSVSHSKFSPTFLTRIGFETFVTNSVAFDMGINYHHLLKGDDDTIGTGDDNRGIAEMKVGFSFYFGGYKDTDKDGIEDRLDKNPLAPEDYDGFNDDDGIPDLDNDNDGIVDAKDKSPNTPEDFDGFQDDDGIPDPDNDKDGIPDSEDSCPDVAEDIDGFQDENGCPDLDNDNDGIPDKEDACPD